MIFHSYVKLPEGSTGVWCRLMTKYPKWSTFAKSNGKSPCFVSWKKLTTSITMFNRYVELPEGIWKLGLVKIQDFPINPVFAMICLWAKHAYCMAYGSVGRPCTSMPLCLSSWRILWRHQFQCRGVYGFSMKFSSPCHSVFSAWCSKMGHRSLILFGFRLVHVTQCNISTENCHL